MKDLEREITQKDKSIQLTDAFVLKYDARNKWIEETYPVKKGKHAGNLTTQRVTGYLPNFEMLLTDFCIKYVARGESKTVIELLDRIAEAEKLVAKFAKSVGRKLDD